MRILVVGVVFLIGAVLLSFVAHEKPTKHIEKQISNVTITG
jgi:hypothetical protein